MGLGCKEMLQGQGGIWVRIMDSAKSYISELLKLQEAYLDELPLAQEQCTPAGRAVDDFLVKYRMGLGDVLHGDMGIGSSVVSASASALDVLKYRRS